MTSGPTHEKMAADIWSVADLLRGTYRRSEYGHVILPFTVLRRLDAVMAPTRQAVRTRDAALTMQHKQRPLELAAKLPFYNTSKQDFTTIAADATQVAKNLRDYNNKFSENVKKIIERFDLDNQITRLAEAKLLYQVVGRFAGMKDLDKLSTHDMGYVFEHLIRKFYEDANAEAGDHFTPREVIHLMVNLLVAPDMDTIIGEGQVINILVPACGNGGMLTAAEDKINSINPNARVFLFGQEFNAESWATCESEMLLRNQPGLIYFGNSFSTDGYPDRKFDYLLANPPFGVEWKNVKDEIEDEAEIGYAGRFGAGLPRINDGSFLSCSTCSRRCSQSRIGERAWRSFSTARRCSRAAPGQASLKSDAGSSRTTGSKASSRCQINSSTTPEFPRTSGSCPTGRRRNFEDKVDPAGRPRPVGEDAQVPRRQAQGDKRRADQARQ